MARRLIDADALLKELRKSCEYHAENSREFSLLQRDIIIVQEQPTIDAVPIEFIEKRIAELKKLNEYEFIANGGYTSPSDYEQWELERLIRDWKEENNGQG